MISQQMEEYLEAIVRLEDKGEPVTTSALARDCQVAPPTATEMLQRLASQGLVTYEPRRGASLTDAGRRQARAVLRRHRLWERFLHDVLGLRWDRVHDQACELEHVTSPDLERRIAEVVGASQTCPHGHTIPGPDGEIGAESSVPLTALAPSQAARVVSIAAEEDHLLRRLGALGIRPEVTVLMAQEQPEGDELALMVSGKPVIVDRELASQVNVSPLSPGSERDAEVVRLGDLAAGEVAAVTEFRAGRGLVGRCVALGFTPGVEVKMLQNSYHGPVIVLVRDTRIALGRGEAQKIVVTRKEEPLDGAASQ